jgi:ssDNA-binding Zn-finger/Zn-ribbon topoisomerase 1
VTVWGQNRYETNRSIVKNAYQAKDVTQALLVSREAFADAVSASALAYREDIPIFLVSQADQGLMEIREDFPHLSSVIVIGGIERVSASVEACFPEVIRIAGTNRYETSRKVDEAFFSDQKQVTAIGMPPENYIDLNYPQFHAKPESVEKAIQVFYEEEIRPNDTLEIKTLATPAAWEPSSAVMDHRNIRDGVKRFKIKNPDVCCTYYLQHQNTMHYGENLDKVAEGDAKWNEIIEDFYARFKVQLEKAEEEVKKIQVEDEKTDEICPKCGKPIVIKRGRYGKFKACTGFPDCNFTRAIVKEIGVDCPRCNSPMVERVSKRGRVFYGCSSFPKCNYATWYKPTGEVCPECKEQLLVEKVSKKGTRIVCNDKGCSYNKK